MQLVLIESSVDGSQCIVLNGVVVLENENDSYGYPIDDTADRLSTALNVKLQSHIWAERRPDDWEDAYKLIAPELLDTQQDTP